MVELKRALLCTLLLAALALLSQAPPLVPAASHGGKPLEAAWVEPKDALPRAQAHSPEMEIEAIGPAEPLRRVAGSF